MNIFTVARHYFKHPSIWLYLGIAMVLGYFSFTQEYIQEFWYAFVVIFVVAPFFEWFVHKYVLHIQVGNLLEIDNNKNYKKNDTFEIVVDRLKKQVKVLEVKENTIIIAYGYAKNKFIREYMQRLHIGHHKNPEVIQLVFAQPSAAILIFIEFFLLSWLFTFNLGFAVVFTFYTVLYYLHYEWMHLAHHIPGYNHIFPWSNKLKRAHLLHHYSNENFWWGITNNFGDIVMGTFPKKNDVDRSKTVQNINHFPLEVKVL